MRAIAQRYEFHSVLQRKNPFDGLIYPPPQRLAGACRFNYRLEGLLNERRSLRKEKQVISSLKSPEEQLRRETDTRHSAHGEIVSDGESLVAEFLPEEALNHARR